MDGPRPPVRSYSHVIKLPKISMLQAQTMPA
ncbi:MAG: hypothetical protein RIR09_241, partial [Pseudomonadota bacterium]